MSNEELLRNAVDAQYFMERLVKGLESKQGLEDLASLRQENKNLRELLALHQKPDILGKLLKQKVLMDALGIKPGPQHVEHGNRPSRHTFASAPNPGLQNLPKEPKGHSTQHHGLQKHSVGGFYPWAIVGIGNGAVVHYELHNLVTDERVCDSVRNGVRNVVQFHGTHGYQNARSCLEAVLGPTQYAANWGAFVGPMPKNTSRR